MRIGIVVTDAVYLPVVTGLVDAARERHWATDLFLTDTGVMLLTDDGFVARARSMPGSVAVCEHSIDRYIGDHGAAHVQSLADDVVIGGQYQDAELVSRCDRVLVF